MPTRKDLKRIVRARMIKTGESYTSARTHVLSKARPTEPPAHSVDHAALAGMSDDRIAAKTGRTWKEWVRVLDTDHAAAMPHRRIAELLHGKHNVPDWWAQTVTVGYERIKGLRDRGQRRGGGYEAGKSRTFGVPVKALFDAWADDATRRRWLGRNDVTVRTATSPKGIRLQWPDGTVVVVLFSPKGRSKSMAAVVHTKLPDRSALESAKKYWTDRLDALGAALTTRD
ncbi:MAG TPA: hypothetical protein VD833_09485 [Vicinamibacterales bacterium]|nr:hypothetical protein [Vicinamibacterales bacterium]